MTIQQAIKHTKNKPGFKQSITGLIAKIGRHKGNVGDGWKFTLDEFARHFEQAKIAWLEGDLETVAEFFGLYT